MIAFLSLSHTVHLGTGSAHTWPKGYYKELLMKKMPFSTSISDTWEWFTPAATKQPGCCHFIFPRHTMPNLDQIYAISEVIILNNDQHQQQKAISTKNSINSKINQHLTPFVDWCYCGREVLFEKVCLFVVYKFVLLGKQFLAKQIRGIE